MRKLLLSLSLLVGTFAANAQVLQSDNFNALTVGNVTTDFTGATAGQGSYYVDSSNGTAPTTTTNAAASNAAIVSTGGINLNTLGLTGPNGDKGATFMWKDGLSAAWAARTPGNNIFEVEFDINLGGITSSLNRFGLYVYNSDYTKVLVGVVVNASTKEINLVAYSTPTGSPVNNYTYSLSAAPGIQIPASQFSRLGISYNSTTGAVTIKGPGIAPEGLTLMGSAPGEVPAEVDFVAFSGSTTTLLNSIAGVASIDNYVARASATDMLLSNEEFVAVDEKSISVYPNPVNDIVNINSPSNTFNSVSLSDINGRTVKNMKFSGVNNAEINISDLNSGIYFLNITTDNGSATKKIIKN